MSIWLKDGRCRQVPARWFSGAAWLCVSGLAVTVTELPCRAQQGAYFQSAVAGTPAATSDSPAMLPQGLPPATPWAGPVSQPYGAGVAQQESNVLPGSIRNPFTATELPMASTASHGGFSAATGLSSPVDQLLATASQQEHSGNSWQAIQSYRQALQWEPQNRKALISFARMKHRGGDFDGAIALYSQLLQIHPRDAVALNDLGLCLARKGDLTQAAIALQMAVQQAPDNKRYRNNLAVVLVESRRDRDALQVLQAAHGPAIAHFNLAWLMSQRGRTEEAIGLLQTAVRLDPSLAQAHEMLASLTPSTAQVASAATIGPGDHVTTTEATASDLPTAAEVDPLTLAPQSAEIPEGEAPVVRAADYESAGGAAPPPDVEDFTVPGIEDYE